MPGEATIVQPQRACKPAVYRRATNCQRGPRGPWPQAEQARTLGLDVIVPHLPHRDEHTRRLLKEGFDAHASRPPIVWIVFGISHGDHPQNGAWRKRTHADIPRPACVVIRGHQQNSLPATRSEQLADGDRLFEGITRVMRQAEDRARGYTSIGEIVLL